jgi:oxygen-independent coproporphyrinogen-3 oxidase
MSDSILPWQTPRALYVHIPFCAHHCGYCDFAVVTGKESQTESYLDALTAEMSQLETKPSLQSVFLGGGTPSHLQLPQLERLLRLVHKTFTLEPSCEWTIEANPESLDADKVALLADHGVNRVSLGAQSFRAETLAMLERQHDPTEISRAVERVRRRMEQVSLDLIFAVPGQSLNDWQADLRAALQLQPSHLSTYGLTYEKGTPLWKQRRAGRLIPLTEETESQMYEFAMDHLESVGFEHYEISNFAKPGCRSRHNGTYWANEAYFGFGLSAARYVAGNREVNTRDFVGYIRRCLAGESPTQSSEQLDPHERARETMAVQLRRMEGINRERFVQQTTYALNAIAGETIEHLVRQGLLIDDGTCVRLSRAGKFVADGVIERLLR